MQKAIRDYIEVNEKEKSYNDIFSDIDRVAKAEIERARKKQSRQWRKENKKGSD